MEQSKYENLLERTVVVQESLNKAIAGLEENSKKLNDNFVLHCGVTVNTNETVKDIRADLLKYLKWAILALVIVLGGQKVVELAINYIK